MSGSLICFLLQYQFLSSNMKELSSDIFVTDHKVYSFGQTSRHIMDFGHNKESTKKYILKEMFFCLKMLLIFIVETPEKEVK